MISRVKGTQDFLDCTLFNFIIDVVKKYCTQHNFSEIQTPIIEYLDLFQRSLGLETDVVSKEMFTIEPPLRQAQGDRVELKNYENRICLRPEETASIVRAFVENGIQTV